MKTLSPTTKRLVEILSDGEYHSGSTIGNMLNITRTAVWKCVGQLEKYGIKIDSITGKGHCLKQPLILLDADKIKSGINKSAAQSPIQIDVLSTISSTNDYWSHPSISQSAPWHICLAEQQTAGKGRLGRIWVSPFGANVYLSCAWTFTKDMSELAGLSLVVGLAIVHALEKYGLKQDLKIKWPNDILLDNKKLAGILIEIHAQAHGISQVIIGIGLNINKPFQTNVDISQNCTSLEDMTAKYHDRNKIIGLLLNKLFASITKFNSHGLAPFIKEWHTYDYLVGNKISFMNQQKKVVGVAMGIDAHGYLLLQNSKGKQIAYSAGDASLLRKVK